MGLLGTGISSIGSSGRSKGGTTDMPNIIGIAMITASCNTTLAVSFLII